MSLTLLNPNPVRQTDATGAVCSGAQLYTYAAGTTTNQATYTDATGGTPLANPVVADATGLFPQVWLSPVAYDFYCYTSTGTLLWQSKGIAPTSTTAGFTPISVTGTDTIVGTFSPGISFYQTGQQFQFQAAGNNTSTSVSINISGIGPIPIKHSDGTNLAIADIKSGQLVQLYYTGSFFQYVNYYPPATPWSTVTGTPTTLAGYNVAATDPLLTSKVQPVSASVGGSALTLSLAPTVLDFRSTTLTTGTPTTLSNGSTLSITVPAGATLGTTSGQSARIAIIAINNAGTVEIAVCNVSGSINLDETSLISTTAISAAATSASVVYSNTARTNVAFRVVGFIDISEATAGTWNSSPTLVQGSGGQSTYSLMSCGQQWQTVTRNMGTTYYNTTGKPIKLCVVYVSISGNVLAQISISINGASSFVFTQCCGTGVAQSGGNGYIEIPIGASYQMNSGSITGLNCYELR